MSAFIQRILKKKAEQLRAWKQQGIETYLVVYNTIWTAMPVDLWRGDLTRDPLIDHFIVVAGNPPDDAWVERIW